MYDILCHQLGRTVEEIEALLALDPEMILMAPAGRKIISSIDILILQASLPEAQECLKATLPQLYSWLRQTFGANGIPESPDHMIEWVGDFLVGQQDIAGLLHPHHGLSAAALTLAVPRLIAIFEQLSFGREIWQRAMALLCLMLLANARSGRTLESVPQTAG
jgi:hypothetical protein